MSGKRGKQEVITTTKHDGRGRTGDTGALPVTGGEAFSLMAAIAGVLGLCASSAGLFLRRRNRPRRRFW